MQGKCDCPYDGHGLITCLLYTSDAADERSSVDLGGRRIIKKKKHKSIYSQLHIKRKHSQITANL